MASSGAGERKLGRYHLVEPIGGGPTGEVYRAKVYGVAGFERQFAVKRFHPELVRDDATAQVIARAARVYGNLEHPRIARMHEFGVAGGDTFAATEMVDGLDLSKLVSGSFGQGEPLLPGIALAIVAQIGRAVGYAHGRGICHLGLCPTNALCTAEGEVKVTDFGFLPPRIPRKPADDFTLLARLPYLAPEQIVGEETSPATDVFQLGILLFELLTGERPFKGPTPLDITQSTLSGAPPDPPVPAPVQKVVRRALARAPFERFPDTSALADALEAATRSSPLPGGRRELAALVRKTLDKIREVGNTNISGAFAFPLPAPPSAGTPLARILQNPRPTMPSMGAMPAPPPPPVVPERRVVDHRKTVMGVGLTPPPMPRPGIPELPRQHVDDDAPTNIMEGRGNGVQQLADYGESQPLRLDLPSLTPRAESPSRDDPTPLPLPVPEPDSVVDQLPVSPRRRMPVALVAALGVAVAVGGGWFAYDQFLAGDNAAAQPDRPKKRSAAKPKPAPAPTPEPEAEPAPEPEPEPEPVAVAPEPEPEPEPEPDEPPIPTGKLVITSTPKGARVFIDGTEVGKTPYEAEPTGDSFRLALIKPGYALHVADIQDSGTIDVPLREVSPPGGPAGIKVRCKKKNRYYVFIDGADSGQLCPTERLGVEKGEHVIEIYDPITDSRQTFSANVKETRLSLRVKVD